MILAIIICILIILSLLYVQIKKTMKILTGIICIDRDSDLAPQLYNSIKRNKAEYIIIVTRNSDLNMINFWKGKANVITVPHYDIQERHNFDAIIQKRNIIVQYAIKYNYDAIWFVDADVIPLDGTLDELVKTDKDICFAPYKIKRYGYPCVGIKSENPPYIKDYRITDNDKKYKRKECIIGGLGCTLVKSSAFHIKIEYTRIIDKGLFADGEDLGFFINCYKVGLKCEYLPNYIQPHLYDRTYANNS